MFEGREYLLSNAKYLKLDLTVPHEEMLAEARALKDRFILYRENGYKTVGWKTLPIIGISEKDPYAWNQYHYKDAREAAHDITWTEIAKLCPVTANWLRTVYPSNSFGRVRFMLLEAGGSIEWHTDTTHSILGAINIALSNPPECKWHWRDQETLAFRPGDVYAMNISYEHSIQNPTLEDRYHLIIHHYDSTPEWKKLMTKSMEKYEVQGDFHYSTELF
jgi:hypothetical protein